MPSNDPKNAHIKFGWHLACMSAHLFQARHPTSSANVLGVYQLQHAQQRNYASIKFWFTCNVVRQNKQTKCHRIVCHHRTFSPNRIVSITCQAYLLLSFQLITFPNRSPRCIWMGICWYGVVFNAIPNRLHMPFTYMIFHLHHFRPSRLRLFRSSSVASDNSVQLTMFRFSECGLTHFFL